MSLSTVGNVDPHGTAAIERLIASELLGSASYHAELESTNSTALQNLRDASNTNHALPRLYLADQQTAGRGRHGRTWISDTEALTFSLLVKRLKCTSKDTALLSIAVGVAIARAIEFLYAPLRSRLKWPNDVYVDGGKVAGILLETVHTAPEQVVIGIGMNVNQAPALPSLDQAKSAVAKSDFAKSHRAVTPKSIAGAVGRSVCRFELLESIVEQINEALTELTEDPLAIVNQFRQRCVLSQSVVQFQDTDETKGTTQRTGLCQGISDHGELMIETELGLRHCRTGEVNQVRVS